MKIDIVVPITPENAPKTKYKIPMSLWLVENNHLETKEYRSLLKTFSRATRLGPNVSSGLLRLMVLFTCWVGKTETPQPGKSMMKKP